MELKRNFSISKKTKILFRNGDLADCFYVIKKGMICQFALKGDRLIPLSFLGPKDFLGVEDVINGNKRHTIAIDIAGDAELSSISKSDLDNFFSISSDWTKKLISNLAERINKARGLLADNQIIDEKLFGDLNFTPEVELKLKKLVLDGLDGELVKK